MLTTRTFVLAALTLVVGGLVIGAVTGALGPQDPKPREVSAELRGSEIEVLEVRSFVLDEPFTHGWRQEQPQVSSGVLLVLKTDPELVRARQSAEPVLYVGDQTAERCNHGGGGGNLVALVPAPLDESGQIAFDLATTPIWFGTPDLPERIDARTIRTERRLAATKGLGAKRLAARAMSFRPSNDTVYAGDRDELDLTIADLIEFYSPTEVDRVELLRLPRTQ